MSDNKKYGGHMITADGSHAALTSDQAEAFWMASEKSAADRAERMPTARDALSAVLDAQQRLNKLGWWRGVFRLKPGDECAVVEFGSTGMWTGWLDDERKYVHYCGGCSSPDKVWLKPLADLTDDERSHMEYCDKDSAEY